MCKCVLYSILNVLKSFVFMQAAKKLKYYNTNSFYEFYCRSFVMQKHIFYQIHEYVKLFFSFFRPKTNTNNTYLSHFGWIWRLIHINLFVRGLTSLLKLYTISFALFLLKAPTLFVFQFQYDIRKLANQSIHPGFSSFFRVAQSTPYPVLLLRKFSD